MCFDVLQYKYIFKTFARRNDAVLKWYHVTMKTRTKGTECALKEEKTEIVFVIAFRTECDISTTWDIITY